MQQLIELDVEILEAKKRSRSGLGQNAWLGSRYQDGVSTRLEAIYSEQNPGVVARLQQQRDELAAQIESMSDDE